MYTLAVEILLVKQQVLAVSKYIFDERRKSMEITQTSWIGIALIFCIVGIIICFLATIGYNTYLRYEDKKRKIEVHSDLNSNSK